MREVAHKLSRISERKHRRERIESFILKARSNRLNNR